MSDHDPAGAEATLAGDEHVGVATVTPAHAIAGETNTWRLRFQVGAGGIQPGGGIKAQLPDSWHMGERMTAKPVHSTDPGAANFVAGSCSDPSSQLRVFVEDGQTESTKFNRAGIDGRSGRYVYAVAAVVEGEPVGAGETIELVFGERSGGSPGFAASRWCDGPEEVVVAVDAAGSGAYTLVQDLPTIEIRHDAPAEIVLTAPSSLRAGSDASLHLVVLDVHGNRCTGFEGVVALSAPSSVSLPASVEFGPDHAGVRRVPLRAEQPGIIRISASHEGRLGATSNPIECTSEGTEYRLFWAELHSHGHRSFDAVGRCNFDYAREVSALDVFALTDHCEGWAEDTWDWLRGEVENRYEPGSFTTILAYEATFRSPYGHHNVYFRGLDGVVHGADQGTLLELFEALEGQEALVVPHHTGVCWGGSSGSVSSSGGRALPPVGGAPNPDWDHHDPRLRRLIEIYSGHGLSERYDPEHPLSYENARYDLASSTDGPHYAWDAWGRGHVLGVLGSSDNHNGQPGRGELGLTGIWATELTREAIYDALRERRTVATTGARIVLDFSVDGAPMGSTTHADGPPKVRVSAHGTDAIESVEILACATTDGTMETVATWTPGTADFEIEWTAETPTVDSIYYARVTQQETYRGRPRMAWSSPVWVTTGPRRDVG